MVEEGDVIAKESQWHGEARRGRGDAHVHGRCSLCATAGSLSAVLGDRTQGERLPLS